MRLLHSIIGHILFPKIGRFDFVSERDFIIMHYILEEIPINLPKLVISYMIEASTKSQASLSYGMILTTLFREFRVPIAENGPRKSSTILISTKCKPYIGCGFRKLVENG